MKSQKKTTTKPNDIATDKTTTNPEAVTAGVPDGSIAPGATVDLATARQQAITSMALAITFAVGLARRGRTEADNEELKNALSNVDKAYKNRRERRDASKKSTLAYQATVQDSLLYRDELAAGFRIATGKQNPFSEAKLKLTKTRQPKKLALWFESVASEIKNHQAELDARFGQDTVALTEAKAAALMKAIGDQTSNQLQAKSMFAEQTAARVRLAAAIAKLRFTAEMAFPGNKEILQQFGYAWNQKRAGKKSSQVPQPGSANAGQAVATPAAAATAPVEPAPASPSPVAPVPALPEAAAVKPAQLSEGKGVSS